LLSYFLGLQIKQLKSGTFVRQVKYIVDMLRKFGKDKIDKSTHGHKWPFGY